MKISRSKVIEITFTLTLFVLVFIYAFMFSIDKKNNKTYAYNNEEIVKEEIIDIDVSSLEEEPQEEVESIVYDDMTLEQLEEKINNSLNSDISGYGMFIASYSLEKGIDPYLATAIMLHETGCKWGCSYLVNTCNNVGGQKGSGCGAYAYFNSLDEGIIAFINNLSRNYIEYGLTTPELINPKYAEDPNWSKGVNKYIEQIKAQ